MTDYTLSCRGITEGGVTCVCQLKCGMWSDIQLMEDGSGMRMIQLTHPFTTSDSDNYIRCPCGVSVGKALIPGWNEGVYPTAISIPQKVSLVSADGWVLTEKQVANLFLVPPVHPTDYCTNQTYPASTPTAAEAPNAKLEADLTAVKATNAKLEAALALRVGEISDLNEELATCDGLGGCGRVAGRYKRKKQEEKRKKFQS